MFDFNLIEEEDHSNYNEVNHNADEVNSYAEEVPYECLARYSHTPSGMKKYRGTLSSVLTARLRQSVQAQKPTRVWSSGCNTWEPRLFESDQ